MVNPLGPAVLVTGANRGIGFALIQMLAKQRQISEIFAACRNPDQANELKTLSKAHPSVQLLQMDVSNDDQIAAAVTLVSQKLENRGLNVLINNAAILTFTGAEYTNPQRKVLEDHMAINIVGPIMVTDAFLPLLRKESSAEKPSLVINISSESGSIQIAAPPAQGNIAYGITKAGLNMYTRYLANGEMYNHVVAVSVHPGWLRTDMGTEKAPNSVEWGASSILESVSKLTIKDNGRFVNNQGLDMPF